MENATDRGKVDAIFDLREAVETKVHAQIDLETSKDSAARDALKLAESEVEAKTQAAINMCNECDEAHSEDTPHIERASAGEQIEGRSDNLIRVNFGAPPARS